MKLHYRGPHQAFVVTVTMALLFILLGPTPARAQVSTADILGTALDSSGRVLVGVKVTVANLSTGLTRTTTSNESGNFLVSLLPIGRYSVRAESAGFKAFNVAEVTIAAGDRLRVDTILEVGQVTESINVVAQATALQSDSSSLGTLINERAVQDLPINGRNFFRLATPWDIGADEVQ